MLYFMLLGFSQIDKSCVEIRDSMEHLYTINVMERYFEHLNDSRTIGVSDRLLLTS